MATTVTKATLKVQIQEKIVLNDNEIWSTVTHDISQVGQVDERVLKIPTHEVDILVLSSSAGAGTYATSAFQYARFTNLDDANFVRILLLSGSAGSRCELKLPPKRSMVFTSAAISGSSAGVAFGSFDNFTSIKAKADSAAVDLGLFVATT